MFWMVLGVKREPARLKHIGHHIELLSRRLLAADWKALLIAFAMTGCGGSWTMAPQYTPQAGAMLSGVGAVGQFRYLPHERHELDADQLATNTPGDLRLALNVDRFVRNAVLMELRAAGVHLETDAPIAVQGGIERFASLASRSPYDATSWIIAIHFQIVGVRNRELLFDKRIVSQIKNAWSAQTPYAVAVLAKCIAAFLSDERVAAILQSSVSSR